MASPLLLHSDIILYRWEDGETSAASAISSIRNFRFDHNAFETFRLALRSEL